MSPKSQVLIKGMDQRKDELSQDILDKPTAAAHTARKPSEGLRGRQRGLSVPYSEQQCPSSEFSNKSKSSMKSRFRFQEVNSGRLVYGISPCFVSGSIFFFLIFKSFQNFPFMSLFHGSPILPCRSLYGIGMDFMAITGVSCRLLCSPYLIAMAAATSAS